MSSTGFPFLRRRRAFLEGGSGSATSTSISSGRGSRLRFLPEAGVSSGTLSVVGSVGSGSVSMAEVFSSSADKVVFLLFLSFFSFLGFVLVSMTDSIVVDIVTMACRCGRSCLVFQVLIISLCYREYSAAHNGYLGHTQILFLRCPVSSEIRQHHEPQSFPLPSSPNSADAFLAELFVPRLAYVNFRGPRGLPFGHPL